jgi:CRP-like cAMP-binding protein
LTDLDTHLKSDVDEQDAEGLLALVQSTSTSFRGFKEDELPVLAENMSIMQFDEGETVLEQGEPGSWFGVLLSGTLRIDLPPQKPGGEPLVIRRVAGDIIGEMAMWQPGEGRTATMKGEEEGLIATMLVSELATFVREFKAVGLKLMRLMGTSAIGKSMEHAQRVTSSEIVPNIDSWKQGRPVKAREAEDEERLEAFLDQKGLLPEHVEVMQRHASFHEFKPGEPLLKLGQTWPYVMIVLRGSVKLDRWGIEVAEGGQLGGVNIFGISLLSETSSVTAGPAPGALVGFETKVLEELFAEDGELAHRMLRILGEYGTSLAQAMCTGKAKRMSLGVKVGVRERRGTVALATQQEIFYTARP